MNLNTPRGDVLAEADELIHGERNNAYGSPTQNFTDIAALWSVLLARKLAEPIEPREVADMMIAMKLARNTVGFKRDNYVDIAGYAGCGWEAASEPKPE